MTKTYVVNVATNNGPQGAGNGGVVSFAGQGPQAPHTPSGAAPGELSSETLPLPSLNFGAEPEEPPQPTGNQQGNQTPPKPGESHETLPLPKLEW